MELTVLEALEIATIEVKEYIDDKEVISYKENQALNESARTTAKNNVGVYVGENEPYDALDGDIWVSTTDDVVSVTNIHLVDAGNSDDLTSIDFSKYAVGDIILVTKSS